MADGGPPPAQALSATLSSSSSSLGEVLFEAVLFGAVEPSGSTSVTKSMLPGPEPEPATEAETWSDATQQYLPTGSRGDQGFAFLCIQSIQWIFDIVIFLAG